jgi:hypothetical protein
MVAPDGREVEWDRTGTPTGGYTAVYKGTTQPAMTWNWVYTTEPTQDRRRTPAADAWEMAAYATGAAALGFVSGMLLVTFFWHWRRRRYVWPMLLPLGVAAFVCTVFAVNDEYQPILPLGDPHVDRLGDVGADMDRPGHISGPADRADDAADVHPAQAAPAFRLPLGADGKSMPSGRAT